MTEEEQKKLDDIVEEFYLRYPTLMENLAKSEKEEKSVLENLSSEDLKRFFGE